MSENILELEAIEKVFISRGQNPFSAPARVRAVDGVSMSVRTGETFALVGESGSGKSTLGRVALRLTDPTAGTVTFDGADLTHLKQRQLRHLRPSMQVVFQDPYGSLNPRQTVEEIIGEPLKVFKKLRGKALADRVGELMDAVGLDSGRTKARPGTLSGGQRQRVGIARAIALNPKLILADEALSALDVSVQAQIANLMVELQDRLGLSYLFIAHGLPIVRQIAQHVGVMYLGRIVESGTVEEIFDDPQHPYTRALMESSPVPDPTRRRNRFVLAGEPPSLSDLPQGCRFRSRCPIAQDICAEQSPPTVRPSPGRTVECHFPGEL